MPGGRVSHRTLGCQWVDFDQMKIDISKRFWAKVNIDSPLKCWNWTGARIGGYPRFMVDKKNNIGTRWLFFHLHPEADRVLKVCHHCDNPGCVNPWHLFLGTQKQNVQDMICKGRRRCPAPRGEANGNSVLTENIVRSIRASKFKRGEPAKLAKEIGISASVLYSVIRGESWRHVC